MEALIMHPLRQVQCKKEYFFKLDGMASYALLPPIWQFRGVQVDDHVIAADGTFTKSKIQAEVSNIIQKMLQLTI